MQPTNFLMDRWQCAVDILMVQNVKEIFCELMENYMRLSLRGVSTLVKLLFNFKVYPNTFLLYFYYTHVFCMGLRWGLQHLKKMWYSVQQKDKFLLRNLFHCISFKDDSPILLAIYHPLLNFLFSPTDYLSNFLWQMCLHLKQEDDIKRRKVSLLEPHPWSQQT